MMSSTSITKPTHNCLSPFPNSNLEITSTNYTHSMRVLTAEPETSPNAGVRLITIELQVQGWYKLYVEPTRGYGKLTMEEDYLMSPKFPCHFKIPFFISIFKVPCNSRIKEELDKLPISPGLAWYLKPFILESVLCLARRGLAQFKLVFDVKVIEIDLVNYQQCESYRRHGLVW